MRSIDKNTKYGVGISGGKDSTALILFLLFEKRIPKENITFNFCDTGWESPVTLKYLDYLRKRLDIKINRLTMLVKDLWKKEDTLDKIEEMGFDVNEELSFELLARIKSRFPSTMAKFCTTNLKLIPTEKYYDKHYPVAIGSGEREMVNVSGVRRLESIKRRGRKEWEFDPFFKCWHWLPIVDLTAHEVFELHKKYSIEPNPLYKQGMARVGCFPCIHASKGELASIAKYYPERFDYIAKVEEETGAYFFNGVPDKYCTKEIVTKGDGKKMMIATALDTKRWALNEQIDLKGQIKFDFLEEDSFDLDSPVCTSKYGLCE